MARAPDVSVHDHFGTRQQNTQLERRLGHSHLILSLITRRLAILAFSSYRGIVGHITTMMDYAQIHIFDACGHYKGRLLLILILHNVMHDITSTFPVDVAPSARFTQNGCPMSIAGGRQEWFGYYWLWLGQRLRINERPLTFDDAPKGWVAVKFRVEGQTNFRFIYNTIQYNKFYFQMIIVKVHDT